MMTEDPKGACRVLVDAWALKGLPYQYFGAQMGTILVLVAWTFWARSRNLAGRLDPKLQGVQVRK